MDREGITVINKSRHNLAEYCTSSSTGMDLGANMETERGIGDFGLTGKELL
jgi:hypothetical protein